MAEPPCWNICCSSQSLMAWVFVPICYRRRRRRRGSSTTYRADTPAAHHGYRTWSCRAGVAWCGLGPSLSTTDWKITESSHSVSALLRRVSNGTKSHSHVHGCVFSILYILQNRFLTQKLPKEPNFPLKFFIVFLKCGNYLTTYFQWRNISSTIEVYSLYIVYSLILSITYQIAGARCLVCKLLFQ